MMTGSLKAGMVFLIIMASLLGWLGARGYGVGDLVIGPDDSLVIQSRDISGAVFDYRIRGVGGHLVISTNAPAASSPQLLYDEVGIIVRRQHVVIDTGVISQDPDAPISGLTLATIPGRANLATNGDGVIVSVSE